MEEMSVLDRYECEGQIELTAYLESQIVKRSVMDLTAWINSKGKSQYNQIGDVIERFCERYSDVDFPDEFIDRLINAVSIYVLEQSSGYMNYLRKESSV